MLNAIIDTVKDRLQGLTYVDKFGGLAMPITKLSTDEMGFGKKLTFPISASVEGRSCWETGKYSDLVPDSNRKSVFYFEQLRALSIGNMQDRSMIGLSTSVRLVGWLNLPKLGHTDNLFVASEISLHLINLLRGEHEGQAGTSLENATIEMRFLGQPAKSADLFRAYTYDNQLFGLLLHPYDYFALDFDVLVNIPRGCISEFVAASPVDCLMF